MVIFITDSFKLDLTHLNIRFSEKNSFFYTDLIKQHSFPFKIPRERNFIDFFNFVASPNSTETNKIQKGKLFRNDRWFDAELQIIGIKKEIEAIFYLNIEKLLILNEPLISLPWPEIPIGNNIYTFADDTKEEAWPETPINFVEIFDPERYATNSWAVYSGFINECLDTKFIPDHSYSTTGGEILKMTEIRPFIYFKEILKFIFQQIGYTVAGDFMTDPYTDKALYYNQKPIAYRNIDHESSIELDLSATEYDVEPGPIVHNYYIDQEVIHEVISYDVTISIEGEFQHTSEVFSLTCYYNNVVIYNSVFSMYGGVNEDLSAEVKFRFNVPIGQAGHAFKVKVKTTPATLQNLNITREFKGTDRPLYKDVIKLSELLPDGTVAKFLENLKETFNLSSDVNSTDQIITFDFFSRPPDASVIDLSKKQPQFPDIKLNKQHGYKIPFGDGEIINIDKEGAFVIDGLGFETKQIPFEPLPIEYLTGFPSVKHQDSESVLFFNQNENAKPFLGDEIVYFNRVGFIHYFLRTWFFQLLNSEDYNMDVMLPLFVSCKIQQQSAIRMHNSLFIVETINRSDVNNLFEKLKLKLFKIKNYPKFEIPGDVYLPPIIVTTDNSMPTLIFTFVYHPGNPYFPNHTVTMFANTSTDPQGFDMSFQWQLESAPSHDAAIFTPQNTSNSISELKMYGVLDTSSSVEVKLTVTNTHGLVSTRILTVNFP